MFNWFKREPRYPASCITQMPAAVFPRVTDKSKPVKLPYSPEHIRKTYDALILLDSNNDEALVKFTIVKILAGFSEDDYIQLLVMLENPRLVKLVLWNYNVRVKLAD